MDDKKLIEASELVSQKKFEEAKFIIEADENYTQSPEALKLLGLCAMNLNDSNKAIDAFEKAIAMNEEDATSWYYLAVLNDTSNNFTEAEKAYLKVIELRNEYIDAYKNLSLLYIKNQLASKAKTHIEKLISLNPLDYQPYYMLGTIAITEKDFPTAIENFEKAIGLNEKVNPSLLNSLGAAYFATNQIEKAQKTLESVIEIDPNNPVTYYHLGNIAQIKKDYDKAFNHFQITYNLDPSPLHLSALAYSALKAKKADDAVMLYKTLCLLQPEKQNYQYNLACAYFDAKNYNEAINLLKKLVMMNPQSTSMAEKLAEVYAELGEYEDAKLVYELLIKKGKISADTYYNYALLCMKSNDCDKAQKIFKKVISLQPENAIAHKDLGVLYLSQRLFDYAQDEFNTALKLAPDDPKIIFEFANYLYATGDYNTARTFYIKAFDLCPDDAQVAFYMGLNYLALNELEAAKEAFLNSKNIEHNDINVYHLARVNYYLGNYDETHKLLNKLNIKDIDAKNLDALALYELDRVDEAIEIYKKILEKFNENINITLSMAKCYIKINNKEEAINSVNEVLSRFSDHEEALKLLKEAEAL